MKAIRNIRLCTKDCLCLYVCPTHATDTENGKIDLTKCIGCGLCAKACPSHAISMVPDKMPEQQHKSDEVVNSLFDIVNNKVEQELIARNIAIDIKTDKEKQFVRALELSNHIMAEDLVREAGYMLPQSDNGIKFLKDLLEKEKASDFPTKAVEKLLEKLQ